jgi:isoamylase
MADPVGAVSPGWAAPLGATVRSDGVDFAVFAKRVEGLELVLFASVDDIEPTRVITLDPQADRTADYWHLHVGGLGPDQLYGFRVPGSDGAILLDPYGRGVALPAGYRRPGSRLPADGAVSMKSVVIDPSRYDWEGDRPLGRSLHQTVIYEAHLAGFTASPSSGIPAERRGTYAGFIDKIPYLADLGITAIELLPIFAFDPQAAPAGLINHWGYQPVGFFAPHQPYASRPGVASAVDEFRDLVKALHTAGIEVILDVVFNHTAEAGADGPTISFRGLADDDYYLLDEGGDYLDYSGCGNTLNANGPIVRRMIVDSLRYWVQEMHVDGFRFDLAAVLSRDEAGEPMAAPPTLWDIETDPVLAGTKLIAEAWDAGGLYQVGSFVGDRWSEWNGRFRDDVRSFLKGDRATVAPFSQRFLGSPDIYGHKRREPGASINFVTCHDGFTLNDLVSYDHKHNEANGEQNRDGSDQNLSWNGGVEGPTDDPGIQALRAGQIRNFLAINLLAIGTPMLTMGDEIRRTQNGNNNGYAHADPTTWFDWSGVERHADLLRFTKALIRLRRRVSRVLDLPAEQDLLDLLHGAWYDWSGIVVDEPDLSDDSHSIALTVRAEAGALHLIFNAYWEPLDFALPAGEVAAAGWRRVMDTRLASPDDIVADIRQAPVVGSATYRAGSRSVVLLVAARTAPDQGATP